MTPKPKAAAIHWKNIRVKLGDLKPWDKNPRKSTKEQAARILESFRKFGQVELIAIGPDLTVYDGHQRLSALLALHGKGYAIDARQASRALTVGERRRLVIALHAGATGSWDWDKLKDWDVKGLLGRDAAQDMLGQMKKDSKELETLLGRDGAGGDPSGEKKADQAEVLQRKWRCRVGQVWALGDHRLIVGDCTDAKVVDRLLGDERPALLWTDPPYGVELMKIRRPKDRKDGMIVEGDGTSRLFPLLVGFLAQVVRVTDPRASFYICAPPGPQSYEFATAILRAGMTWSQTLVWIKSILALGHNDYQNKYEPIFYGGFGGRRMWRGGRKKTTTLEDNRIRLIWLSDENLQVDFGGEVITVEGKIEKVTQSWPDILRFDKPSRSLLHPTMKPVPLIVECILNSSDAGAIVFDPFCGSGSTLLACEMTKRVGRMIELKPKFAAATLQRWADLTGKTPRLVNS